jgi:hypothetical protein
MDRAFERAAAATAAKAAAAAPLTAEESAQARQQAEDERLRTTTAPMNAADAVARITLAFRDGDYFR